MSENKLPVSREDLEKIVDDLGEIFKEMDRTLAFVDRTGEKVKMIRLNRVQEDNIKAIGGVVIYLMAMVEVMNKKFLEKAINEQEEKEQPNS